MAYGEGSIMASVKGLGDGTVIVLNSGGIRSTTLVSILALKKYDVQSVHIRENHSKSNAAYIVAKAYDFKTWEYPATRLGQTEKLRLVADHYSEFFKTNTVVTASKYQIPGSYIQAPFASISTLDLVIQAIDIGAPIHKSWVCYEDTVCGSCQACSDLDYVQSQLNAK